MSTIDLSTFAPARPATPGSVAWRLRKEWTELMDQLFDQAKVMPGDEKQEAEKRQWVTRWDSLKSRIVATKDVAKNHQLDMDFTFPADIYVVVTQAQQRLDRWKLEPATVARAKSGRPLSMSMTIDNPSGPTPGSSTSRSARSIARPVVEIVANGNFPQTPDARENDPPCERCRDRIECVGRRPGGRCDPCNVAKKKYSLSNGNREPAAKAPGLLTFFGAAAKESEVTEVTIAQTHSAMKRKRSALKEKPAQDDEVLKRRIRDIEADLLQLSNNAHEISNKAYSLAVEIRKVGESLEDRE